MSLLPHHDGSPLHVSDAAPTLGDTVVVRLRVPDGFGPVDRVVVRTTPDEEPVYVEAHCDGYADGWEWWSAGIVMANPRNRYRWVLVLQGGGVRELNQAGLTEIEALDAFDFAIIAGNTPPEWMTDAVMYQIVPDRFARSGAADTRELPDWAIPASWGDPVDPVQPARTQQLYGGDLDGVVDHLDHLERLGVNLVYHTPIFPARSNHRYDSSNFTTVDPLLGGDEAYRRLIAAVHGRGMRIMGDLTSNHSGDGHEWFQAARHDLDCVENGFYYFLNADRTDYESWLGAHSLPKFDWRSAELRRRFIEGPDSVVARWLAAPYRTDGWRIDVANMTGRLGAEDLNADVRRTIRQTMTAVNPDTLLLAEFTNDAAADFQGDAWHGAMTYTAFTHGVWNWLTEADTTPYRDARGDLRTDPWFFGLPGGVRAYTARQFLEQLQRFTAQLPWRIRLGFMQALNSHDTGRFATYAKDGMTPLAVGLTMSLPGIPVVYAGDEFGLVGVDGEASRAPIPWDRTDEPGIAERIELYRRLIGIRRGHVALQSGGFRVLHADDHTIAFVRESAEESVLIVATDAGCDLGLPAPLLPPAPTAVALFGVGTLAGQADGSVRIEVAGPAFCAWRLAGVRMPVRTHPHEEIADETRTAVAAAI